MSPVHLHLMLNHLPVVGIVFAALLLGYAVLVNNDVVKKISLAAFVLIAMLAVPAYLTGEPAEEIAEGLPGVTEYAIEQHEEAAQIAFASILLVGAMAVAGLVMFRTKAVPRLFAVSVLALSVVAMAALAWTANLGGKVRHTEIRSEAAVVGRPSHDDDD